MKKNLFLEIPRPMKGHLSVSGNSATYGAKSRTHTKKPATKLHLEALEDRRALAADTTELLDPGKLLGADVKSKK